ncbi:hypothetical protein [Alkalibaculum sporogenes]|uniref:hypothetical protein n=1 Tax=Alkalibaculum sporogenes TaxID=2655001 RepID=UPI00187BC32E|nr:hypothetical protein [Alkalibaculum sporogenes]
MYSKKKIKDKRQKTKDKRQKTKDKRQKTKDKRQKTKDKGSVINLVSMVKNNSFLARIQI